MMMIVKKKMITVKKKKKTTMHKLKFIANFRFMQSKLWDLIDYLFEIYKKECKLCLERKGIKSDCDFIGFKNNRLN